MHIEDFGVLDNSNSYYKEVLSKELTQALIGGLKLKLFKLFPFKRVYNNMNHKDFDDLFHGAWSLI